jgi:hypothetical protein
MFSLELGLGDELLLQWVSAVAELLALLLLAPLLLGSWPAVAGVVGAAAAAASGVGKSPDAACAEG